MQVMPDGNILFTPREASVARWYLGAYGRGLGWRGRLLLEDLRQLNLPNAFAEAPVAQAVAQQQPDEIAVDVVDE